MVLWLVVGALLAWLIGVLGMIGVVVGFLFGGVPGAVIGGVIGLVVTVLGSD